MRREWTVWLGFTAVVLLAVLFVVSRDDEDDSKLSAGTSVPTTVGAPTTVTTRPPPSSTSSTSSPSTTTPSTTEPPTTRSAPATNPGTVATTQPPATVPATVGTTAPPATEPPLRVSFGGGTYRVNIDLPAGTYRTDGVGPYCYWARLSTVTANPTPADVIASASTGGGPATVAILPSDAAFTTSGCDIWLSV